MPLFCDSIPCMVFGLVRYLFKFLFVLLLALPCFAQKENLNYYLANAIENSPLLHEYQNKIISGRIDLERLKISYKPIVYGTSNNLLAPVLGGIGYDQALTNIASFSELVNIGKTFASKGYLNSQKNAIELSNDSLLNYEKITEQDITKAIITQYITVFGEQQQLKFNKEISNILKEQEVLINKLTHNNIYRQTDYLTFLVTLKQQELQMKQLQIQTRSDLSILNYLCGLTDTVNVILEEPNIHLLPTKERINSIYFSHYKTDSIALVNSFKLIDYSYKPKVNVFANAGFSTSFLYQAYKDFGYSFGLNVAVPIFDWNQKKLLQQKVQLAQNILNANEAFFINQYNQEAERLKIQLKSIEMLNEDINEQIKYADALIAVNSKLLQTGDAKIADYIIAINNYLTAKNLLTQNRISKMQIINQLNYWNH